MPKNTTIPELLAIPFSLDHAKLVEQYLQSAQASMIRWLNPLGEGMSIDEVRAFTYELAFGLTDQHEHIFVLLHLEKASVAAQNALLKTLEEPPARARIVLTCVDVASLLPTITSRCQVVNSVAALIQEAEGQVDSTAHDVWNTLLAASSYSHLIAAAEGVKEREDATALVRSLINLLYTRYLRRTALPATGPSVQQIRRVLERLHSCLQQLELNVNVRLALESCFFDTYNALQP